MSSSLRTYQTLLYQTELFNESLDNLTSIFDGMKLIFVDEVKGYCIWDKKMGCINFERITRGHPRFRVHFKEHFEIFC